MSDGNEPGAPASEPLVRLDIFGTTHPGKVRTVNEDHFFIAALHKTMRVLQTSLEDRSAFARAECSPAHLLVVADGLGGMGGGEMASGSTIESVARNINEAVGCYFNFDVDAEQEFLEQLKAAVERAHEQLLARQAPEGQRPATTLTLAALAWPRAYIVHVGDSRAYYLRRGRLRQLTRDQTVYEALADEGAVPEDATGAPGGRNRLRDVLTSAIGFEIAPSIGLVDLLPGDHLLLCTDGLTRHVSDDEIAATLGASGSAEEACTRLLDLTLERGARDNVTVIVARSAAA